MDIGSVMPMLKAQNGADSAGTKEGHWFSEDTYNIPGGKVDTVKETSVQSGQGYNTQATTQTSVMKQEFAGVDLQPNPGNLCSNYLTSFLGNIILRYWAVGA